MDEYLTWTVSTFPEFVSEQGEEYVEGLVHEAVYNIQPVAQIVAGALAFVFLVSLASILGRLGVLETGSRATELIISFLVGAAVYRVDPLTSPLIRRSIRKRISAA